MSYHKIINFLYKLMVNLVELFIMGNKGVKKKCVKPYTFKIYVDEKIDPNNKLSKRIPLPRSGHRIVCDTKNLYSFGGYNPSVLNDEHRNHDELSVHAFPLFQELWKFNFASKKWVRFSSRESLPQELASNAVIRHGNILMVISLLLCLEGRFFLSSLQVYGGTGSPFGYRCSNQLYICRLPNENSVMKEIVTVGNAPLAQYGQALVFHNDYLYTIGGTTGFTYTCDIHRLNMKTFFWEAVYICQGQGDYEPEGRYRHEIAFDGQNIYVLGGGTAEHAFGFAEIPVFNVEKRQWYKQKTFRDHSNISTTNNGIPPARRCHGAVQIDCDNVVQVFISGGYDGTQIFDDLWCLNLKTYKWTLINTYTLPYPTYFHSAAVTPEGKMYIFGGIFAHGDIERNNVVHCAWLCIPKLSEMCWEALLHYNPQIVNLPKTKLIDAGLPRHFIQD
ncbi:kelch domain-containing protein 10 [Holotrichia oblita]|uniref:Kelch domain-containing protein 10 n=1 Tax=Holotrichia oblita TaxID=644536 RepID=A0ACB9T1T6_HOLOL|nr:kelch domain-containing protein 10 [Holotrichia oblita]